MLLVEQGTPGCSIGADIGKLGHRGVELCEVVFDDARVPAENRLGDVEGRGVHQTLSALDRGRIYMAAASVGIARASLEIPRLSFKTGGATNDPAIVHRQEREGITAGARRFRVYDREAEPCWTCGTRIERVDVGGRGIYFCTTCQPARGVQEKPVRKNAAAMTRRSV